MAAALAAVASAAAVAWAPPAGAAPSLAAAGVPSVTVTQAFAGLNQNDAGGYAPPDVQVAAGPGYLVEMANLAVRTWRLSGSPPDEVSTQSLGAFYGVGDDTLTDPRVLFDALSGRWFASSSDISTGAVLLAVTESSDPTAGWHVWRFDAGGSCPDQPRLGTADQTVVFAADLFTDCNGSLSRSVGAELWIVNKAQLLAGDDSPAYTTFGPSTDYASLTPARSLSATSTEYVASVDDPSSSVVHVLAVSGVPPGNVSVQEVATPETAPLLAPPVGVEPDGNGGTAADVRTNDARLLDAAWQDGTLWLSANSGCTPAGDTELRSCARVAAIATATGSLLWDTDLGESGAYLYFPALQPDAYGDLVVVYGESTPTLPPEVAVVARTPEGTFTAPVVVGRSAAPAGSNQNQGRWGDYFGAARDASDPGVVWVAGETGPISLGSEDWTTALASLVVGGTAAPPPPLTVARPSGVRPLAATGAAGRPLRLAFVALAAGTDVRELVTVGSPGRTVFRTTTAAGTLVSGRTYGVRWLPPRRLRGAFRFCVRVLAPDGSASAQGCATVRLR